MAFLPGLVVAGFSFLPSKKWIKTWIETEGQHWLAGTRVGGPPGSSGIRFDSIDGWNPKRKQFLCHDGNGRSLSNYKWIDTQECI